MIHFHDNKYFLFIENKNYEIVTKGITNVDFKLKVLIKCCDYYPIYYNFDNLNIFNDISPISHLHL